MKRITPEGLLGLIERETMTIETTLKCPYTPGPWKVTAAEFKGYGIVTYEIIMPRAEISQANADLIAAAPALLEACRAIRKLIDDGLLVRDTSNDDEPDWRIRALPITTGIKKLVEAIALTEKP